jgi:23S rRNA (cytidine1920-2'-O)/16S rRNA (cytidine1409-2'-O)-methyltransferase
MVERGLADNPSKARAHIMAGDVIVNDHRIDKAGEKVSENCVIRLRTNSVPFVSRGGVKLEHALKLWPSAIDGAICLDVGASTGGFTEVLLNFGAKRVYAVDVGYGQLAEKLRIDPRVTNLERTHILHLTAGSFNQAPTIAVIDVSFISLAKILPHVLGLLKKPATIYALIKPQFEAGRSQVAKGGIVKDPMVHQAVVAKILALAESLSLIVLGVEKSPITGGKGNIEFLIALRLT